MYPCAPSLMEPNVLTPKTAYMKYTRNNNVTMLIKEKNDIASVEEIVLNPENAFANRATRETRIIRNMRPITRPTRRTRKNEKFRETNVIPRSRNENVTNTKSNLFHRC